MYAMTAHSQTAQHRRVSQHAPSLQNLGIMQDSLDMSDSGSVYGDGKKGHLVEGNLKITLTLPRDERNRDINEKAQAMCLRFSQDGSVVAVGQADGLIRIYHSDTGHCLHTLSDDDTLHSRLPVTCVRFKPYEDSYKIEHKSIIIATYASGQIKFWHYTSGQCLHTIYEDRQTLSMAFSPDAGNTFVSCGAKEQLYLYDVKTRSKIRTLEASDSRDVMNGHKSRVYTVQFHPRDSNIFLTGGWDDTVQFWDARQKHSFRKISGPHICGDALDIDPVHNHIVTGSWRRENVLQVWHFDSAEKIKTVPQDSSMLYCAQWLGKENILCGGSNPNTARVIDRGTLNSVGQLVDLPAGVYCMDNDRQLKPKIAAGADNRVYIMKIEKQNN